MDSFITIRRRDDVAVPLLALNQTSIYANIPLPPVKSPQAVPRHQEETYRQALDNVSTSSSRYYDTTTPRQSLPRGGTINKPAKYHDDLPETPGSQRSLKTDANLACVIPLAQPDSSTAAPATQTDAWQPRRKENNDAKSIIALLCCCSRVSWSAR